MLRRPESPIVGVMVFRFAYVTVAVSALVVVLSVIPGCRKKNQAPPEERGSIFEDAGMSGPSDQRYGSQCKITIKTPSGKPVATEQTGENQATKRTYKNCRNPVAVTEGNKATPEGTLFNIFKCLLTPDSGKAYRCFLSHVDTTYQRPDHVKRYWFASARKDDGKHFRRLVYGKKNPSYVVCERRNETGGAVRIFVGKNPPVGSNPPMVLHQVNKRWLLKSFTPH